MNNSRYAGTFLFAGAAQFILLMMAAEAIYPNYSVSGNWISDLGIGASSLVFNSSIILFGACVIAGAYFLFKEYNDWLFLSILCVAGLGAIGVGIFVETNVIPHTIAALLAFFFGAAGAIYSGSKIDWPFSIFCRALGIISLAALALTITQAHYLGLGPGGMERMVAYPILIWCLAFSGAMLAKYEK